MQKLITLKKNMVSKKSRGFTMVELIIVIALIAALTVAAVIGYSQLTVKAEETLDRQEAAFIIRTLNQYNQLLKNPVTSGTGANVINSVTKADDLTGLVLTGGEGGNSYVSIDLSITPGDHTDCAIKLITYTAGTAGAVGKWGYA